MARAERFRSLGRPGIALAILALAGCESLPDWTGLRLPPPADDSAGPVVYPDLAAIPERAVAADDPAAREATMRSLLEDRALTAGAGAALRQDIESEFVIPELPPGS